MPKGESVERNKIVMNMFLRGPVTVKMVAERLHIHRHSAQRWIDQISRQYPVCETGLDYSGGGKPGIIYEIRTWT